jgi:ATP-dependent RNA helicase RhlE
VGSDDKRGAVLKIIKERSLTQAIVFVNSKLGCARLARSFERDGLKTNALHGDKSQDERLKALEAFKRGEVDVLVATDVAARGLDIADLPAVFNFDVPFNAEDYVHRIGRTGRAGASGLAVTLVTRDDARLVSDIEKLIKKKIDLEALELNDERPAREPRRREAPAADETPRRTSAPPYVRPSVPAASRDPFFDRPYEPSSTAAASPTPDALTPSARGLSPNIKPKKKVAALFGAKRTEEPAG